MKLQQTYLEQNVGRPTGLLDFDLRLAYFNLRRRRETAVGSVWSTSWGFNLMCLVLTAVLGGVTLLIVRHWDQVVPEQLWLKVVLGFFGLILAFGLLVSVLGIFKRGTLVIDRQARELRFHGLLPRGPLATLSLDEIRLLSYEQVVQSHDEESGSVSTYTILVAELEDGRLASLAVHPEHGLLEEIAGAVDPECRRARSRPPDIGPTAMYGGRNDPLLEELKAAHELEWTEANLEQFRDSAFPIWWQGQRSGTQFAIRDLGQEWVLVVGRVPEVIDLELSRPEKPGRTAPRDLSIAEFLPSSHPLVRAFCCTMKGVADERFSGRQLTQATVGDGLATMSDAVRVVGLYRNGLEVTFDPSRLTRASFDRDLQTAIRVTEGLVEYAGQNPSVAGV